MKVGVYLNVKYKADEDKYLKRIYDVLTPNKIECVPVKDSSVIRGLNLLLVLGGDGTILSVASECARCGVKIMGVNFGHMGFLTGFEAHQMDEALSVIISGKFDVVERSMLEVNFAGKKYYALNEAVVQRSTSGNSFSNTVNLHAEIDGSTVDNFTADGLIISTPTGSTAYSLSAGGSILTPELNAFIMTPICPHSLHSRPIVFSDRSEVKLRQAGKMCSLSIIIDGRVVDTVRGDELLTVKKADRYLETVSSADSKFFDKLLIKLSKWSM